MYVLPPQRKEQRALERRVWGGILAVAGAAAGLAALVYAIGAATLWLALRNRGYSPDVGIEHQPKSQLIGLGLRGILLVGGLTLALGLVAVAGAAFNLRSIVEGVARRVRFRYAAIGALALVLAASLVSWRWVALAVPVAALVLVIAAQSRLTGYRRKWSWIPLVVAAVLAALAWQYGGPVDVTAVRVTPRTAQPIGSIRLFRSDPCKGSDGTPANSFYALLNGKRVWVAENNPCGYEGAQSHEEIRTTLRRCSVPYFGQSGGFVYLGRISRVWEDASGLCHWRAAAIVELPRDEVRLQYLRGKVHLNQTERRTRPYKATWKALRSFFEKL